MFVELRQLSAYSSHLIFFFFSLFISLLTNIAVTASRTPESNVINLAHLLPSNPSIQHEKHVLRMCANDLKERSILPKELEINIYTMESCNRLSGVEHAAYLHYKHNASIYVGPGCNTEMLIIGRLVSRWNVPIIAHLSGDDALSERSLYDTLASVALTSANEMARATLAYIDFYGWKKIGLVRSSVNFDRLSLHSLKNLLKEHEQVHVQLEVELDPYMSPDQIIASGKLKTLRNNARIIVLEMGMDLHTARNFMVAVHRAGMKSSEFVYIIPWLAHVYDHYPWEASGMDKVEVRAAYEDAVVITAHGYDKKFIDAFEARFSNSTGIVSDHYATLSFMSLYDAIFLYGLAIRDAYEETRNLSVYLNGRLIWEKMTARQFIGATGQVLMNNKAVRVPSYATYHIRNGTARIVVELTARFYDDKERCVQLLSSSPSSKGDKRVDGRDCSEHVAHEVISGYWRDHGGMMPPDLPRCGYDGALCDYTPIYLAAGLVAFFALVAPISFYLRKKSKERVLYEMSWRVPREQVRILEREKIRVMEKVIIQKHNGTHNILAMGKSRITVGGDSYTSSTGSLVNGRLSTHQALANGVRCSYKRYAQTRNITFPKSDLAHLKALKLIENENLNKFYGICFNQQGEFIVLWTLCQRGSLEDVLFNEEMKITRNFQVSFAKDVVKGVAFLHASELRAHGMLCLQNCLVDSNWNVRLTNFGTGQLLADKLRHNELKPIYIDSSDTKTRKDKTLSKDHGGEQTASNKESKLYKLLTTTNQVDSKKPLPLSAPQKLKHKRRSITENLSRGHSTDAGKNGSSHSVSSEEGANHQREVVDRELFAKKMQAQTKKILQQAPEVIREYISMKQVASATQPADIYAMGMVLYQILFKLEPFHDKQIPQQKLLEKIALASGKDGSILLRPTFPSQQQQCAAVSNAANGGEAPPYNLQLLSAIEACWLEIPEMRPNIKRLKGIIMANLRSTGTGSLVDQMVKMMEDYTTNLEQLVRDRTTLLEDAQQQADRLLKNMLPASIAEDLKAGKPVLPQLYANATVLFSDIDGFTRISSTATPLQVVSFLNDLFSSFDTIIAMHDAYKVETIGDSCMIVSGVPNDNGNAHAMNIAEIALRMRVLVANFKLTHWPEEVLAARIGFHSGSVAAGVVGLAAPRYCLFGDTVNMASRMESTGVANKIQISESSYNILKCFYSQFIVAERGKVEIKGKGGCLTYFLEGKGEAAGEGKKK